MYTTNPIPSSHQYFSISKILFRAPPNTAKHTLLAPLFASGYPNSTLLVKENEQRKDVKRKHKTVQSLKPSMNRNSTDPVTHVNSPHRQLIGSHQPSLRAGVPDLSKSLFLLQWPLTHSSIIITIIIVFLLPLLILLVMRPIPFLAIASGGFVVYHHNLAPRSCCCCCCSCNKGRMAPCRRPGRVPATTLGVSFPFVLLDDSAVLVLDGAFSATDSDLHREGVDGRVS